MKRIFLIGLLFFSITLAAQNFNSADFVQADMALVSMDYEKAQELFSKILKSDPENANINFLNGLCLINIPGRKKESLEFLQKAEPFATSGYKYGNPREKNAPLEAIKYLGIAKKLHNDLQGAIEQFSKYITAIGPKEKDEIALANELIESCNNAMLLQQNKLYLKKNATESVSVSAEMPSYPVVNYEETLLFYAAKGSGLNNKIFLCRKTNGTWGTPEDITAQLGAKGICYPSAVSADNLKVYLTVTTAGTTDIYYSVFSKSRWQKMVKLDKPVNGSTWDSHAFESPDGNSLYFSSDRKGGIGNMDIYRSDKDAAGIWGKPENLGNNINTEKNELMPVISADNTKLFFKSEAYENIGGYDIFVSERISATQWGQPKNMGYPVNSTDDDIYYMPARNGQFAYMISDNQPGLSRNEISFVEILEDIPVQKFAVKGFVLFKDGSTDYSGAAVDVFNTSDNSKITTVYPESLSGNYSFELPEGIYNVIVTKAGYNDYSGQLNLTAGSTNPSFYAELEKVAPVVQVTQPEPEITLIPAVALAAKEPVKEEKQALPITTEVKKEPVKEKETPVLESFVTMPSVKNVSGIEGSYTIQFMASYNRIDITTLAGKYPVEVQKGNDGYYRYITGFYSTKNEAEQALGAIRETRYKQAFVRLYDLNSYLNKPKENSSPVYTIQLMAIKEKKEIPALEALGEIRIIEGPDGYYRYTFGQFDNLAAANNSVKLLATKGFEKVIIRKISEIPGYE